MSTLNTKMPVVNKHTLYNVQTMIRPFSSLDVSLLCFSFQTMASTLPEWPSSVLFIDKLACPANPLGLPSVGLPESIFNTFKRPSSPPTAMQSWLEFHSRQLIFVLFGMAICTKQLFSHGYKRRSSILTDGARDENQPFCSGKWTWWNESQTLVDDCQPYTVSLRVPRTFFEHGITLCPSSSSLLLLFGYRLPADVDKMITVIKRLSLGGRSVNTKIIT